MDEEAKAAWTIKSMPVEERKLAVACAARAGLNMAEWMVRAVRNQARIDAGDQVLPPGTPAPRPAAARSPAPLGDLVAVVQALGAIAESSGVPVPRGLARSSYAAVREQLRGIRGLPEATPRKPSKRIGQTIDGMLS